jgi:hypothetical protein
MFYLTLIAGFIILRIFFYKKKEEDIDEIIDHDYSSNSESEAETDAEYENKLICDATDNMRRAADEPSDDITRDFYDESEKRPEEWTSLSDAEKREVLDKDLDAYMKEGRKKLLDTVRD